MRHGRTVTGPRTVVARLVGVTVVAFGAASAAAAQDVLFTHLGPTSDAGFGYAVSGLSDIDGDAVPDYVVGSLGCTSVNANFARVFSGATGALVREHLGDPDGCYGMATADLGDLDGDGVTDYAVAAVREDTPLVPQAGRVWVYSGVDGSVLRVYDGDAPGARFGIAVAPLADVDLDGWPDMVVGSPWDSTLGPEVGSVDVFSGQSGALVRHIDGEGDLFDFGYAAAGVDDLDGDGVGDLLVGAPIKWYDATGSEPEGYARLFSGATGDVLATFHGVPPQDHYGMAVAGAADLDGDGIGELIIGAPRHRVPTHGGGTVDVGRVEVRSGATLAVISETFGDPLSKYGSSLKDVGDLDGDGVHDILIGACYCQTNIFLSPDPAWFELRSGATGALIVRVDDGEPQQSFAWSVAPLGDVTSDGVPDFVVGAVYDDAEGYKTGAAFVYSGADLALTGSAHEISLGDGGEQAFALDAGPAHAGAGYLVLGTISGTSPGFGVNGQHVPLNPDPWFDVTYAFPNNGILVASLGTLDGEGQAQAAFVLPAGLVPPSAIGLVFHHAFVAYLPGAGVQLASNALPLTLLP